MISYIDAYKDQFGVEAICRVLKQADRGFITSRGYRKATTRVPSARALSDGPGPRKVDTVGVKLLALL